MSRLDELLEQARRAEPGALPEDAIDALVRSAVASAARGERPSRLDRMIEQARQAEPEPLTELEERRMAHRAGVTGAARYRGWTRRRLIATVALAAGAAAAIVTLMLSPPPEEMGGREHEVAVAEPAQLELMTGDRLVAAAGASFRVERAERLSRRVRLESGSMLFDVRTIERGRFEVTTPRASVLVLGTVFSVNASERGTTVRVYEGRVEVRGQDRTRVVTAGGMVHVGEGEALEDALRPEGERAAEGRVSHAAHASHAPAVERTQTTPVEQRASESVEARASARVSTPMREPTPTRVGPEDVRSWIRAGAAERALAAAESAIRSGEVDPWRMIEGDALRALGRPLDAAIAYRRAVNELPAPRRQQAGFLEARLRANELGDPEGALEALRDAGVTGARSPLRERGLSLEVRLLVRLGRQLEVVSVAETYLREYPEGPDADELRALTERRR